MEDEVDDLLGSITDEQTEEPPEVITKTESWHANQKVAEKKVDPFLLQAILLKAEHRGTKSQFQHRKRCETFFRSLSSRYSNLLGEEFGEGEEATKGKLLLDLEVEGAPSNMKTSLVEQLAKRVSHLRISIALEKRKSQNIIEAATRKKSVTQAPNLASRDSSAETDSTISAKMSRHRWQVAIGLVMGMAKMASHAIEDAKEPFTVGDLIFDPNIFKANKTGTVLSADSKFILSQLPEKRSKEQVEDVVRNLRDMDIKAFNEYPMSIQVKLVKVARYGIVTPQRVIIQQGRPSENLYFLLDGTVVVIEKQRIIDNAEDAEDLIILRKGAMFGETEMINRLTRRATVITKTTVKLLTIERSDLLSVFANQHQPNKLPAHIRFLRQCEFMYFWPLEEIMDNLDKCAPYFFKKNMLIIEDSLTTDFLVVIRAGKCRLIRKLYKHNPTANDYIHEPEPETKLDKTKLVEHSDEMLRQNFRTYSRQGSEFSSMFGVDQFEHKLRVHNSLEEIEPELGQTERTGPPNRRQSTFQIVENPKLQSHTSSMRLSRHGSSKRSFRRSEGSRRNVYNINEHDEQNQIDQRKVSLPKSKLEKALLLPATQEYMLDRSESKKYNTDIPMYIQVDTLKPNDVFGLDTLVFDKYYDSPTNNNLCLVSGDDDMGVEVVLLSKTLFIEHASEQVAWRVRRMMKVYPDAEMLLDEIERQELWTIQNGGVPQETFTGKPILLKKIPWK